MLVLVGERLWRRLEIYSWKLAPFGFPVLNIVVRKKFPSVEYPSSTYYGPPGQVYVCCSVVNSDYVNRGFVDLGWGV